MEAGRRAPAAIMVLELEDVFRLQTVIRLCRPLPRTALLARQPCARQFFGNCPIRVDSRFCRVHPYTDKSRRCDSHSTLEGRTELGRPLERRSPKIGIKHIVRQVTKRMAVSTCGPGRRGLGSLWNRIGAWRSHVSVHPRACGKRDQQINELRSVFGSSPRVRGTH
jgi:hypothetical protein